MTSEKRVPSTLKSVISPLNSVYSELERLSLEKQDEEKRKGLMEAMQKQHAAKTVFDERATASLQRTGIEKAAPRTLRSNIARSSSQLKSKGMRSNSTSTSSSFRFAKVVAKEEVVRLRLKQQQEKHELERKQEEIKREMGHEQKQMKRQQEIVNLTPKLLGGFIGTPGLGRGIGQRGIHTCRRIK